MSLFPAQGVVAYNYLPVYKASYDLLVDLFLLVKDFSREYKYTLGESIQNEAVAMIRNIYRANRTERRSGLIQEARENVETIRLYIRLLKDLRQVSLERFVRLNERVECVSRQLAGWHRASD